VVIVTFQSGGTLQRCLAALAAQTVAGFETILSDNASTDGAPQAAAAADPSLVLIDNGANLGFAAGNNRAAARARGRWLVLLNPDAYPQPDFIERLLAVAESFPAVRCFTARQRMAADPVKLDGLGDAMAGIGFPFRGGYGAPDPGPIAPAEVFSPCGAAMMIDRALFLKLGGFDERFFCYCEDVDLGYRLRLSGERVVLAPDAVVLHEGSVSTGGRRSDFSIYHGARNRLWLFVKDTPPLLFWLTLPAHLAATAAMALRAAGRRDSGALLRGLKDAIAGLPDVWRQRQALQDARLASSWEIARLMTWSPLSVGRRRGTMRAAPKS
jgi:GT2 family glycosyltransferase